MGSPRTAARRRLRTGQARGPRSERRRGRGLRARPVMSDFGTLVRLLRRWTHNHDPHVREAVELLIWHEMWIRRADFQRACLEQHGREVVINWRKAREFADGG